MSRSRMKVPYTMRLLLKVSKELNIRKRAWEKVRREIKKIEKTQQDVTHADAEYWCGLFLDKMTKILKAERRER